MLHSFLVSVSCSSQLTSFYVLASYAVAGVVEGVMFTLPQPGQTELFGITNFAKPSNCCTWDCIH